MAGPYQQLSQADVDHFLAHGWVKLSGCFTQEDSDRICSSVWTRLGMDPSDKSTWHTERVNMPSHNYFSAADFAPKAWSAICDLVGGESRVADFNRTWNDGLIVNLGTPQGDGKMVTGNQLQGWHVDGDFFVHFLDSPEQGLLVIPLFTDIKDGAGGTMICPAAIPHIAKHLHDNPEGVSPRMTPRAQNPKMDPEDNLSFYNNLASTFPPSAFVEATGSVGDVYLLHPLMMHSASNNMLRIPRIITNPPVSLNAPFDFDREDASQYSVVERKTLAALGVDRLAGWKITGSRDKVVPERLRKQNAMKEEELRRLEEIKMKAGNVTVREIGLSKPGVMESFTNDPLYLFDLDYKGVKALIRDVRDASFVDHIQSTPTTEDASSKQRRQEPLPEIKS